MGALLPPGPNAGQVVDLNRALTVLFALEDVGAPEAQADSLLPTDIQAFLRQLTVALPAAQRALGFVTEASARYDAPDLGRAGVVLPRRGVHLVAPVPRPGKILAVARNYPAHVAEAGGTAPPEPILFLKAPPS
ncbi:MAG TPA: hypothetical protein VKE73_15210, partial [Myxococcota bacterium]|nr:hypothetical protein [Myxococcota bacterium]